MRKRIRAGRPAAALARWCVAGVMAAGALQAETPSLATERQRNFEELHREAVRRKELELGPAHPATASALRDLGLLLLAHDRPPDAVPYLREALARRRTGKTADPLELARDAFGLAQALDRLGERSESETACGAALRYLAAAERPDPELLAEARILHALLALGRDDPAEAARRYREAVEARPDPTTMLEYAGVLEGLGERRRAWATLARALALRTQPGARPHPQAGEILHRMALIEAGEGDFDEARELLERAEAAFAASSGPDTAAAAATADTFGNVLRALGELNAAERKLEQALNFRRAILGPRHADVAATLNNLAGVHHLAERLDAAEPLYREALGILEERFGEADIRVAETAFNLGYLLIARDERAEAAGLLRRALAMLEAAGAAADPMAADIRAALSSLADP